MATMSEELAPRNVPPRPPKCPPGNQRRKNRHPVLSDAAKQIRLLYLYPGSGHDDLEFHFQCWDVDTAPAYIAVSYTWGKDENHKVVYANGSQLEVWPNCYEALRQVRQFYPGSHVWIDSVCIDQDNLVEKGKQVAMMSKIYKHAALTCACVGPAADNSEMFFDFLNRIGQVDLAQENLKDHPEWEDMTTRQVAAPFTQFWNNWSVELNKDAIDAVRSSILAFANLTYWTRLWIVQELALSRNVVILYGDNRLPWQTVRRLRWLPWSEAEGIFGDDMDPFWPLVDLSFDKSIDLPDWATTVVNFRCKDIRDKVYGVLSLLQWRTALQPPAPDYTRTPLQLAICMASHMNYTELHELLSSLHITARDPDLRELVKRRQQHPSKLHGGLRRVSHLEPMWCAPISANKFGKLQCSLQREPDWGFDEQGIFCAEPVETERRDHSLGRLKSVSSMEMFAGQQPRSIGSGRNLAALLCSDVQVGDYIALPDLAGKELLILRPVHDEAYELIGQGFLLPGFGLCRKDFRGAFGGECVCVGNNRQHDVRQLRFDLDISDEDLVVLVGQDLIADERENGNMSRVLYPGYDMEPRFERLITRISEGSGVTARIAESTDSASESDSDTEAYNRKWSKLHSQTPRRTVTREEARGTIPFERIHETALPASTKEALLEARTLYGLDARKLISHLHSVERPRARQTGSQLNGAQFNKRQAELDRRTMNCSNAPEVDLPSAVGCKSDAQMNAMPAPEAGSGTEAEAGVEESQPVLLVADQCDVAGTFESHSA